MKGGIFSDQHCPICGGAFRDNDKDAWSARIIRSRGQPDQSKIRRDICKAVLVGITGLRSDFSPASATRPTRERSTREITGKGKPLGFENLARNG